MNALDVPDRRKRYSSSFGYRYAQAGGPASDGSAGSSERERKDGDRPGVSNHVVKIIGILSSIPHPSIQ